MLGLPFPDFREFVVSIGILNATTSHSTTDLKQRKVYFKLTLADHTQNPISTWYATVEKFAFIEGLGYTFEVKNGSGDSVSISEVRMGDGAIDHEILANDATLGNYYVNLEANTKMAAQCPL